MREAANVSTVPIAEHPAGGCGYPLEDGTFCDATRRSGSAYCARHHEVCHVASGSPAEQRRLREIEALAKAVGGRLGRAAAAPTAKLLRRLATIERAVLRPDRSLFVRGRT